MGRARKEKDDGPSKKTLVAKPKAMKKAYGTKGKKEKPKAFEDMSVVE